MTATAAISLEAHAKVNLTLEILGKRADGYHNIVSIMQTIELHDVLDLFPSKEVTLECDEPALGGDSNLALKAAMALKQAAETDDGVRIRLGKKTPVAAGVGGGSSDAAATLRGLNRLWNLNWPVERLQELAIQLGSDVPFFLYGGAALVQGKGENVVPLPAPKIDWLPLFSAAIDLPRKDRQGVQPRDARELHTRCAVAQAGRAHQGRRRYP